MRGMIIKPAARYPADPRAVFILALSVFIGLTALALDESPNTLQIVMPNWAVIVWATALTVGSLITLIGMYFQTIEGIIAEQIGSAMVAGTTIFYSVVVLMMVGLSGMQTIGIILAWGLACCLRWFQLQVLIRDGIRRAQRNEFLRHVDDELERRIAERK